MPANVALILTSVGDELAALQAKLASYEVATETRFQGVTGWITAQASVVETRISTVEATIATKAKSFWAKLFGKKWALIDFSGISS